MSDRCVCCGRVSSIEDHHPTGTIAGVHLDPDFTEALCRRCHSGEHIGWEEAGLARTPAGLLIPSETVARSSRRLSAHCHYRAAAPHAASIFAGLVPVTTRWADLLTREIAILDARCDGWRDALFDDGGLGT